VDREAIYWSLVSLAGAAAGLAHFWIDVFGYGAPYIVETFLPACAWIVLYCLAYRFAGPSKKRRWLPLLMAPFALARVRDAAHASSLEAPRVRTMNRTVFDP
jgi:hypothetical protein